MASYVNFLLSYLARGPEALNASSAPGAAAGAWPQPSRRCLELLRPAANQSSAEPAPAEPPSPKSLGSRLPAASSSSSAGSADLDPNPNPNPNLSECRRQLQLFDYYQGYDVLVGLRIATTLTILFVVFILFVIYKTGCARRAGATSGRSRSQLQLASPSNARPPVSGADNHHHHHQRHHHQHRLHQERRKQQPSQARQCQAQSRWPPPPSLGAEGSQ